MNIDVLRKVLSIEGYRLSFMNSGEKALKIVERAIPDLILLDVMMPVRMDLKRVVILRRMRICDVSHHFHYGKNRYGRFSEGFKGRSIMATKPFRQEEVCMRVRTHSQTRILMTQREGLLQNIQANEERFRLLANWSPVGIFQVDVKGSLSIPIKNGMIFSVRRIPAIDESWCVLWYMRKTATWYNKRGWIVCNLSKVMTLKFRLATSPSGRALLRANYAIIFR
ncbi:MAG: hypothetical protein R3E08_06410 [Thiotrichaceae bacterium]